MTDTTKPTYTPTSELTEAIRPVMLQAVSVDEHLKFAPQIIEGVRVGEADEFGWPLAILLKELRARDQEIERITGQSATARQHELENQNRRLREANRRLQTEGPALERDKLIKQLRSEIEKLKEQAKCGLCGQSESQIVSTCEDCTDSGLSTLPKEVFILTRQLDKATSKLPDTWYMDRPLAERVGLLVDQQRKLHQVHRRHDLLQAAIDKIEHMITCGEFCWGGDVLHVIKKVKQRSEEEKPEMPAKEVDNQNCYQPPQQLTPEIAPAGSRWLLKERLYSSTICEAVIVEWSPSGRAVLLQFPNSNRHWHKDQDRPYTIERLAPGKEQVERTKLEARLFTANNHLFSIHVAADLATRGEFNGNLAEYVKHHAEAAMSGSSAPFAADSLPVYLSRLETIVEELTKYAYGKDQGGDRFPAWAEVADAAAAIERALAQLRKRVEDNDATDS